MIRNVAVFCASSNGIDPAYHAAAVQLGRTLAQQNIGLIYGGSNVGLMRAVAESSLLHGGRVVGVIPEVLVDLEVAHRGLTELHITTNMHTRKAMMGELADAFLVLPGGFGTLEEMFEVLTWQSLRLHQKPTFLINIGGFYDKLIEFLDHCVEQGVLKPHARENLLVVTDVKQAFRLLAKAESAVLKG